MLFVYKQDLKLLNNTTESQKDITNTEGFHHGYWYHRLDCCVCPPPPCPVCECLSCQCLSVGWDVSQRLALIPSGVHQTPVPRSSDRRSYYFLITLVARVPREMPHHVTDRSINTGSPRVTEWELTAATPLSRLFSSTPIFLSRLFISVSVHCDPVLP